jgi:putative ABC transport system permease protein
MRTLLSDFRADSAFGFRQMRRNRSSSLICIVVLAIGIGSATAVFTVLYDAILRPLPYPNAGSLVFIHNEFPQSQLSHTAESGPDFMDLSAHHELFTESAAYYFNDFTMTGAGTAQHVDAVNASATLYLMLGIEPELGRTFAPEEDRNGAPKVVILSDSLWHSSFGADPSVLGKSIRLDGQPYQIIGVMPPDFNFPYPATQMWVPLSLAPSDLAPSERGDKWLQVLARLAPGVTPKRADLRLRTLSHGYAASFPDFYPEKTGWRLSCTPMVQQQTQTIRGWLFLAFGAVLCVLLIACTNVSGLLLVQASARQREWAVRAALGANPQRLIRQILTETALLVFAGCGAGVLLAAVLVRLINQFGPMRQSATGSWTYLFATGLCLVAILVAGVFPASILWRTPLEQSLRAAGNRTISAGMGWRQVLVAGQIGVAVALLFTATALSRSFIKLLDVSPGFSPDRVWTGLVSLPPSRYTSPASRTAFFQSFLSRLSPLPGVESVSAGVVLPFSSAGWIADLYFPGRPRSAVRPAARLNFILPGYLETLEIPLLEGRTFLPSDNSKSSSVAIVDQEFVRRYFPRENPIGKLVANNGEKDKPFTIVGVAGNVLSHDLATAPPPEIYLPELQHANSAMYAVARVASNADITSAAREALGQMNSDVALFDVETMPQRISDSVKLRRFVAWLLNSFALVGLLLAALGLYGTLSYMVELRRREMAVRMALGASTGSIRALVARRSLSVALAGLLPGIVLSVIAARAIQSFLFGIGLLDLRTLGCTVLGFAILAFVASWLPVAQASRVSMLAALREE